MTWSIGPHRPPEADVRANKLLWDHLDEIQQETYAAKRYFHVRGSKGSLFRVHRTAIHNSNLERNVRVLYAGKNAHKRLQTKHWFWVHFYGDGYHCAPEDLLLAQKMMIESDEDLFVTMSC